MHIMRQLQEQYLNNEKNSKAYQDLDEHLLSGTPPFTSGEYILQKDYVLIHVSYSKSWFKENKVSLMDWPSQLPLT